MFFFGGKITEGLQTAKCVSSHLHQLCLSLNATCKIKEMGETFRHHLKKGTMSFILHSHIFHLTPHTINYCFLWLLLQVENGSVYFASFDIQVDHTKCLPLSYSFDNEQLQPNQDCICDNPYCRIRTLNVARLPCGHTVHHVSFHLYMIFVIYN